MKKLLLSLVGVVFISGCTFTISTNSQQKTNNGQQGSQTSSKRTITTSTYFITEDVKTNVLGKVTGSVLSLMTPDKTTTLPTNIRKALVGDGSYIENSDFPVDIQDPDVIYISTARPLAENGVNIDNKIYSFNIKTSELQEILSETDNNGNIRRIVGSEGSKLVILNEGFDNSPGPCSSIWVSHPNDFTYLDTQNIADGFKPYTLPPEKVTEGQKEVQDCSNATESDDGE